MWRLVQQRTRSESKLLPLDWLEFLQSRLRWFHVALTCLLPLVLCVCMCVCVCVRFLQWEIVNTKSVSERRISKQCHKWHVFTVVGMRNLHFWASPKHVRSNYWPYGVGLFSYSSNNHDRRYLQDEFSVDAGLFSLLICIFRLHREHDGTWNQKHNDTIDSRNSPSYCLLT